MDYDAGMSNTQAEIWSDVRAAEASGNLSQMRIAYQDVVKKVPDLPAAWLKLGQICLMEGTYRNALAATLEAAQSMRRADRWQALPHVGRQLLRFDERYLIRQLIEEADWDNPTLLAESATLAQQLWLVGADVSALALLENAIQRLPPHHLLHFSKGEVLSHLGRLAEAEVEHELALKLDPTFSLSHRALAYLGPGRNPERRIQRMMDALQHAQSKQRVEDQIDLQYALFKELDNANATDAAWEHLVMGAALRRDTERFDMAAESRSTQAMIEKDISKPDANALDSQPGLAPTVFVVGMPRTGTTVMDRMLSNHPDIASAGELNAFSRAMSWAMDRFYEPPLTESFVDAAFNSDEKTIADRYMQATGHLRAGTPAVIDKNPVNFSNVSFIARSMPSARMVCMVRDPMDACFSNFKEPFSAGTYGYSNSLPEVASHYVNFRKLVAHHESQHPLKFKAVAYEDLVKQPQHELEAVMAFCGAEYQAGQDDLVRNQTPVSTASKSQVRAPLNQQGIGAWRRYEKQLEPLKRELAAHGFA